MIDGICNQIEMGGLSLIKVVRRANQLGNAVGKRVFRAIKD